MRSAAGTVLTCARSWKGHRRASCTMQNLAIIAWRVLQWLSSAHRVCAQSHPAARMAGCKTHHRPPQATPTPTNHALHRPSDQPTSHAALCTAVRLHRRMPAVRSTSHPRCSQKNQPEHQRHKPQNTFSEKRQHQNQALPQPLRGNHRRARPAPVPRMLGTAQRRSVPGIHTALSMCVPMRIVSMAPSDLSALGNLACPASSQAAD